jgi:hypothetical protein
LRPSYHKYFNLFTYGEFKPSPGTWTEFKVVILNTKYIRQKKINIAAGNLSHLNRNNITEE